MNYSLKSIDDIFAKLNTNLDGLTTNETNKRLVKYGENKFDTKKDNSVFYKFLMQLIDPMIIILIVAAAVSLVVSIIQNESFSDVIIIVAVVIINAILGVYQETKAEKSIEALNKISVSKVKVLRDGKLSYIENNKIVVGDIVVLEAGDAVPADCRLVESHSLKIEESALTGESYAVDKAIDILNLEENKKPVISDMTNMAFMGTTVVYGRAKAVVCSTGMNTEIGKIADVLLKTKNNKTPLQIKMTQLSKALTKIVIAICVLVFAIQIIKNPNFDIKILLDAFMIAITLAVAAIPEGLPAVITVILSIGVTKMSKRNAIIRKLNAVETLGCAQIICSDKTGTLTQNKMTVTNYFVKNMDMAKIAMYLCNDSEISENKVLGEPTEVALTEWAIKNKIDKNLTDNLLRVNEIPFDSTRKMMSTVHHIKEYSSLSNIIKIEKRDKYAQFTKGAIDAVIPKCKYVLDKNKIVPITKDIIDEINMHSLEMSKKALRVISCAFKIYDEQNYKNLTEDNLIFIGITGMIDPIRAEVKDSILRCKDAGIKPIMITGDHVETAKAIAIELGIIKNENQVLTGNYLNEMSEKKFEELFRDVYVYARVQPEHKTKIVKAWQNAGYVVAMTGDGVNDAPSIKNADIGIGMGITGTDVTKNVADMVLADDNFATIVNAVEEGRRIYSNILKCIQYLLSSNISEVLSILIATILGFSILKPVHLLWVNFVTDCFPALALGFEEKEPGIMHQKPRKKDAGVFSKNMKIDIFTQGLIITILILLSYFIGVYNQIGEISIISSTQGTTMAFLTMSLVQCFHSLNMRSRTVSIFKLKKNNLFLYISVILSIVITSSLCFITPISSAFQLTSITITEFFIAFGLGILIIPIVELVKFIRKHK